MFDSAEKTMIPIKPGMDHIVREGKTANKPQCRLDNCFVSITRQYYFAMAN
jgi:hypothetical protein